jgi:hypothetical protein
MFTLTWGVDDITEGTLPFDTKPQALTYAQVNCGLNAAQLAQLEHMGAWSESMPTGTEWVYLCNG